MYPSLWLSFVIERIITIMPLNGKVSKETDAIVATL